MDSLCSGVQDCRAATQALYEVRPTYEDMASAAGNFSCFKAESSSAEDLCQNGLAISNKSTISSLGPEEGPFVDAPSTSAIPKRGDTESV